MHSRIHTLVDIAISTSIASVFTAMLVTSGEPAVIRGALPMYSDPSLIGAIFIPSDLSVTAPVFPNAIPVMTPPENYRYCYCRLNGQNLCGVRRTQAGFIWPFIWYHCADFIFGYNQGANELACSGTNSNNVMQDGATAGCYGMARF